MTRALMLSALDEVLNQGLLLLGTVDNVSFSEKIPQASDASIGSHYRHCLDHISLLLEGVESGIIDYDARRRNPLLETDCSIAESMTQYLQKRLQEKLHATHIHDALSIRCKISNQHELIPTLDSNIDREIMFCVAHTIHHYALIKMICHLLAISLPQSFGVAPSTIEHQRGKDCSLAENTFHPF